MPGRDPRPDYDSDEEWVLVDPYLTLVREDVLQGRTWPPTRVSCFTERSLCRDRAPRVIP